VFRQSSQIIFKIEVIILASQSIIYKSTKADYSISTDRACLQIQVIHDFLKESYWAKDIPIEIVRRSIANSLCFGVYKKEQQIGFARIISDYATFAYLADVFILESFRGEGLSKWLMEMIVTHPQLQGLRRWMLATRDAHELYRKYGFENVRSPNSLMERLFPDIYLQEEQ
jgi:GNAT superfamily N-acetyltransferase